MCHRQRIPPPRRRKPRADEPLHSPKVLSCSADKHKVKIPALVILMSGAAATVALWWILTQLLHIRRCRELAYRHLRPDTGFEQRYRELFTHATDPIFTLDLELGFKRTNRAAEFPPPP